MAIVLPMMFIACSKDDPKPDENKFDYELSILHGKWRITHVETEDHGYVDITKPPYTSTFMPTYATFKADGSYTGEGYFGNGIGTYTAINKTITCYVGKEVYVRYDVLSLSGDECELIMYAEDPSSGAKIKCKKQ